MLPSFLLSADNHLRSSQYARTSRGSDFESAFEDLVNSGIARKVTAILIAGDLIDSRRPSPDIVEFLRRMNNKLVAAGIPMYVTSGNHDLTEPHWASLVSSGSLVSGISIIDNQLVTVPGTNTTIYGQPFVPKEKFLEIQSSLPPADILMFHCMTQEMTPFKSESAFSCLNDLPWSKYRVIVIGDIHIQDKWVSPRGSLVLQPGSSELCSSSEPLEKSAYLFEHAEGNDVDHAVQNLQTVPIKTRQVLKFTCMTEEDVEKALATVETNKADVPLVFVKYVPSLTGVPARFAARFDPTKFILRMEPVFGDLHQMNMGLDIRENLVMLDFLDKFLTPGSPSHALAESLLDPKNPVVDLIDKFVEARLPKTA